MEKEIQEIEDKIKNLQEQKEKNKKKYQWGGMIGIECVACDCNGFYYKAYITDMNKLSDGDEATLELYNYGSKIIKCKRLFGTRDYIGTNGWAMHTLNFFKPSFECQKE